MCGDTEREEDGGEAEHKEMEAMNAAAPTTAQKEMEPYGTGRDRCYYDWEIHIPLGVRVAAAPAPAAAAAFMPLAATCQG